MASLFKGPTPAAPPPMPQIDDALMARNARDSRLRRGQGSTILTSERGLPNLGATTSPTAGGR